MYCTNRFITSVRPIIVCLLVSGLVGCESQHIQIPTAFARYESDEGTFVCEYPDGWEAKGGGKNGPVWAKFSSGSALIAIKASSAGSLLSDGMGGNTADNAAPTPQDAPVHHIHMSYLRKAQEEFNSYTETANSPTVIDSRLGPARLSEFTASTSFGTALHGYRATYIGHNKGVTVYCTCPESNWTDIKPAFDHLLSSFERGVSRN